ncbi:YqiJ family protein [Ningiella sp. W23]|uniref:YqiJ family protein n=1 Tax=Ningiella sp. W23 TaxID=3023715 RepID=UPI00375716D4
MFDFLFADANFLFSIAIGIVFFLGLLEAFGLLIGISLAAFLDNISPIDVDLSADPDISASGPSDALSWLCLNRLPLMVWLVLFLTCFGITGYTINFLSASFFNIYFAGVISISAALIAGLLLTARIGRVLARIIPKNESSAVSSSSFSGKLATITTGTARWGSPAEASVIDDFNQKHYVMVEPIESDQVFASGQQVVLVQKGKSSWQAISYP